MRHREEEKTARVEEGMGRETVMCSDTQWGQTNVGWAMTTLASHRLASHRSSSWCCLRTLSWSSVTATPSPQ